MTRDLANVRAVTSYPRGRPPGNYLYRRLVMAERDLADARAALEEAQRVLKIAASNAIQAETRWQLAKMEASRGVGL